MSLKGKTIIVGISASIAAYKSCELVSSLKKLDADVFVVMTQNAVKLISPLTLETLSNNKVYFDMFESDFNLGVKHISLAKKADLIVIAPCTANVAAKLAVGICDDFLTTVVLASTAPVLVAPAMNTNMILNKAYLQNEKTLLDKGFYFISSEDGHLACGDTGKGRLANVPSIIDKICSILNPLNDYKGKKVVVTAGATRQYLDPVRFLSNKSSGKMGICLAKAAAKRGADVTLIAAYTTVNAFDSSFKTISVSTTQDMFNAVATDYSFDFYFMAAAPCDYNVNNIKNQKIKDKELTLQLEKTIDIAATIGKNKKNAKLIAFCAETENLLVNARKKLKAKNADMIVANDITMQGAGFDVDTNIISILTNNEEIQNLSGAKSLLADIILDKALCLQK